MAHAMPAQDLLDLALELLERLHRGVPQIEARLELPRDHVRSARAGIEVRDLEGSRLEVLGSLVPDVPGELGERRRQGMNGILRQLRVGHVSLYAVYGEAPAERA